MGARPDIVVAVVVAPVQLDYRGAVELAMGYSMDFGVDIVMVAVADRRTYVRHAFADNPEN